MSDARSYAPLWQGDSPRGARSHGAARGAGPSRQGARERSENAGEPSGQTPASIKLIYESRDGKLCLFEDRDGHITAVRSARLA